MMRMFCVKRKACQAIVALNAKHSHHSISPASHVVLEEALHRPLVLESHLMVEASLQMGNRCRSIAMMADPSDLLRLSAENTVEVLSLTAGAKEMSPSMSEVREKTT